MTTLNTLFQALFQSLDLSIYVDRGGAVVVRGSFRAFVLRGPRAHFLDPLQDARDQH